MVPISLPSYISKTTGKTRAQSSDDMLYTSSVIPRITSTGYVPRNLKDTPKKPSLGKKRKRSSVSQSADFASVGGLLVFQRNFFNRSISYWNRLPLALRSESSFEVFKADLKTYIWQTLIEIDKSDL